MSYVLIDHGYEDDIEPEDELFWLGPKDNVHFEKENSTEGDSFVMYVDTGDDQRRGSWHFPEGHRVKTTYTTTSEKIVRMVTEWLNENLPSLQQHAPLDIEYDEDEERLFFSMPY